VSSPVRKSKTRNGQDSHFFHGESAARFFEVYFQSTPPFLSHSRSLLCRAKSEDFLNHSGCQNSIWCAWPMRSPLFLSNKEVTQPWLQILRTSKRTRDPIGTPCNSITFCFQQSGLSRSARLHLCNPNEVTKSLARTVYLVNIFSLILHEYVTYVRNQAPPIPGFLPRPQSHNKSPPDPEFAAWP